MGVENIECFNVKFWLNEAERQDAGLYLTEEEAGVLTAPTWQTVKYRLLPQKARFCKWVWKTNSRVEDDLRKWSWAGGAASQRNRSYIHQIKTGIFDPQNLIITPRAEGPTPPYILSLGHCSPLWCQTEETFNHHCKASPRWTSSWLTRATVPFNDIAVLQRWWCEGWNTEGKNRSQIAYRKQTQHSNTEKRALYN